MPDVPTLLQPLKDRLAAASEGPWRVERHDLSLFVFSADEGLQANLGYVGNRPDADGDLIAAAPTDQAKLIAAAEAVVAECDRMDEAVSIRSGIPAMKSWRANRIRAALTQALGGDTA